MSERWACECGAVAWEGLGGGWRGWWGIAIKWVRRSGAWEKIAGPTCAEVEVVGGDWVGLVGSSERYSKSIITLDVWHVFDKSLFGMFLRNWI